MNSQIAMNNDKKVGESSSSGGVNNGFRSCKDLSDIVPLYPAKGLYLKPIAKINVSVNLPQLKIPGKTISSWEVMEKIRLLIRPDEFASLKVTKSTLEFIRLEGDLTDRCRMQRVLIRLEGQRLNLAGFPNILKVRAAEAKDDFPNKHSWDSFFRDAKHMNELKAGERPDTVHISGLTQDWFSEDDGKTPSESLIMKIFKKWGNIRRIDVPAADPYRSRMRLGGNIKKCTFGDGIFFDCYIQYIEYIDFVKLMESLRGMKLLKKDGQNCLAALIKVDFDRTKHMSDNSVAHRDFERKRLIAQDSLAAEKLRRKEEVEAQKKDELKKKEAANVEAKGARQKRREEKRKRKALTVFRKQEEDKVSIKIAKEEKKLIKAQRQLESIRLLDELFDRIKQKFERGEIIMGEKSVLNRNMLHGKSLENLNDASNKNIDREEKRLGKKAKKLKKKKLKREKKRKKKEKNILSSSDVASDGETGKKKLKSALGLTKSHQSNSFAPDGNASMNFPSIYSRFPQPWFYDAAAMMFPGMDRGGPSGCGINRYMRGRGRAGAYSRRRGGSRGNRRPAQSFNPHAYTQQYYKYFANLAGVDYYESDYSRSRSRSSSHSKSPARTRNRSRRRGKSSRSRSQSRSRSSSRIRSKIRRSIRRSCSRSYSRSNSRRSRSRCISRSPSLKSRRERSRSCVKVTRAKSRSISPKIKSRSKSWSLPKSPRQRVCSWSKDVDSVEMNTNRQLLPNDNTKNL